MTELISLNSEFATNRLVLLHGWGADAQDLVPVGKLLTEGFKERFEIVSLSAPQPHPSGFGRQWYPLYPHQWKEVPNAVLNLERCLNNLCFDHIPLEKTLLLGFSQGGAMAVSAGCDMPLRGIISCSGYMHPGWVAPKRRPPILLIHGNEDEIVPISAARQLLNNLDEDKGYLDSYFFKGGHQIPLDAIKKISNILSSWLI